jgi:hypothetical protein
VKRLTTRFPGHDFRPFANRVGHADQLHASHLLVGACVNGSDQPSPSYPDSNASNHGTFQAFNAPSARPFMYQRWAIAKPSRPGAIAMMYIAARRGQAHSPNPPKVVASTTGSVRTD